MNKKGDLTSTQIIMLVIAIIGFGVVLIFLFLINLGGYTPEETCKLSVLTRATTPEVTQRAIPLKCITKKICITDTFFSDRCKEQFPGEKEIQIERLSGSVDEKRRKIEEISANAMYDCWSMMGEGKLDLFASAPAKIGMTSTDSSCVICSRVAIDKSVSNEILYVNDGKGKFALDSNGYKISAIKINDYMRSHQIPGSSLTYMQAFTDRGVSSFAFVDEKTEQAAQGLENKGVNFEPSTRNDMAFVFTQIKSGGVREILTNLGLLGATAAGSVFLSPAGGIVGKVLGIIGAKAAIIGTVIVGGTTAGIATLNALEGQKVAAMHCGEFVSGEKGKEGCSIVQGVSYDFKIINSICGSLEGEL